MEERILDEIGRISEDGLYIVGTSRGKPVIAPLHLALVTIPTLDEIIGIIRTLDALIVGCTLSEGWRHLSSRLAQMTLINEMTPTQGIQSEVRADADGWTVYGLVPVFSSHSRRRARSVRAGMDMAACDGQIVQHGRAYAIGGTSAKIRSMGLAPGDDVTIGIFRKR